MNRYTAAHANHKQMFDVIRHRPRDIHAFNFFFAVPIVGRRTNMLTSESKTNHCDISSDNIVQEQQVAKTRSGVFLFIKLLVSPILKYTTINEYVETCSCFRSDCTECCNQQAQPECKITTGRTDRRPQ